MLLFAKLRTMLGNIFWSVICKIFEKGSKFSLWVLKHVCGTPYTWDGASPSPFLLIKKYTSSKGATMDGL